MTGADAPGSAKQRSRYGVVTAISIIIANMIGTGVFTSLGFQLAEIQSGFVILVMWLAGGAAALAGALSYAELGAALPRSGGEYSFLTRIYHPAAGFVSGWVSATIGFAAPVALAAMTFSAYGLSVVAEDAPYWLRQAVALALLVFLALLHGARRKTSGGFQKLLTSLKIFIIVMFCLGGAIVIAAGGASQGVGIAPRAGDLDLIFSGEFAISLIYVSFAYAGWNAATYVTGEIDHPQKTLPLILGVGAGAVIVLYVMLNAVFLSSAPLDAMSGQIEIGYIAARVLFGDWVANLTGLFMAALLISTVSAMTIAGPRVLQAIGEDFPLFRRFAAVNQDGIPSLAIYLQTAIAATFVITSSFESILVFAGFTVALNSFFTVLGLYILRWREPNLERPFKITGFPVTPLVYLSVTGWTLSYVLIKRPAEGAFGLAVIAAGLAFYAVSKALNRNDAG